MKYLFFFKGQPLLLCCVCCKVTIQDFFTGLHTKNKKNLPFHRRIYRRPITRRYFTESCKKFTGFCHIHRRISDGLSDAKYRRNNRWIVARMSDKCPSARIPMVLPTSITDGITDGSRMSDTCQSARYRQHFRRICQRIEKFGGIFELFWCAFQLISDGITDGI